MIRHLTPDDYHRERWKNGLGWTHEIARGHFGGTGSGREAPPGAGASDWDWRLSIAQIDRACPFSAFLGVDRTLILVGGTGMRLAFADGDPVALEQVGDRIDFAGEQPLSCTLRHGPTRDFNVMWRRTRVSATTIVERITAPTATRLAPGQVVAVHVLDGRLAVDADRAGAPAMAIGAGDTLVDERLDRRALHIEGDARVIRVMFGSATRD